MSLVRLTYTRTLSLLGLLLGCVLTWGQTSDTISRPIVVPETEKTELIREDTLVVPDIESMIQKDSTTTIGTLKIDSAAVSLSYKRRDFTPDPIRAMWLGLAFPGGGQIYNRKMWKLPVFYGGFLGCMYALTWNNMMLRDYSQAYLDIMDDDPTTASYEAMLPLGYSIEGKEERFKTIFKNKKNYFRRYRDLSIFAFIGVYALSVIDAYVDAELSTFDISEDLSLHLEPTIIDTAAPTPHHRAQNAYGLQCSINF